MPASPCSRFSADQPPQLDAFSVREIIADQLLPPRDPIVLVEEAGP